MNTLFDFYCVWYTNSNDKYLNFSRHLEFLLLHRVQFHESSFWLLEDWSLKCFQYFRFLLLIRFWDWRDFEGPTELKEDGNTSKITHVQSGCKIALPGQGEHDLTRGVHEWPEGSILGYFFYPWVRVWIFFFVFEGSMDPLVPMGR